MSADYVVVFGVQLYYVVVFGVQLFADQLAAMQRLDTINIEVGG